jgi:hypothetical protein
VQPEPVVAEGEQHQPGGRHDEQQTQQGLLQRGLQPSLAAAEVRCPRRQRCDAPPQQPQHAEDHDRNPEQHMHFG